jgi:D-tagatose-1,6-bisphosphate aldolase subunit GatZ/KbaZ
MKALLQLLQRHKAGSGEGIYSVCSSHPLVIEAALREADRRGQWVLVEATSNQVNQFGGYSGMTAAQFRAYVTDIAVRASLPRERVLLGGDHLGPNAWRAETAAAAMGRSEQLVESYVAAGFRKIHLDCSMSCADDPPALTDSVIAERAARLCQAAEKAWHEAGGAAPVYVIGTEVPVPGGAAEDLRTLAVTTPSAVTATLETHRSAFLALGLDAAWTRAVALVVQPGVEFDHHKVINYDPTKARLLSRRIESEPDLVYEAHSTDYQTSAALAALVRDHFAILKVGPAATFALREVLWALVDIQVELGGDMSESLKAVALASMRRDPKYWRSYYTDLRSQAFDLQYSLSDRIRYYWNAPEVQRATAALLEDLGRRPIPMTLLSQYLPAQYTAVREGSLSSDPRALLLDGVARVLREYARACAPAAAAPANATV